ncbi:MAG: DUF2286 domain-containing protein [Thermoprotei archaeon]
MGNSNIVIQCDDGSVGLNTIVEGELNEVVKKQVTRAITLWNPSDSDFMVFSTQNESQLKAPLTREMLEKVKQYSPQRLGDSVVFNLPVFVVSYKIQQEGNGKYRDRSVIVISPFISESIKEQLENWVKELTLEGLESPEREAEVKEN